jgi:hypothetical protein
MRNLSLVALFAVACSLFAQAPVTTGKTAAQTPPTTARVFFKSQHAPCLISNSQLVEGIYTVSLVVTLGGIENTLKTKGFTRYETVGGQRFTHVFVDYVLDPSAGCPSLTFAQ